MSLNVPFTIRRSSKRPKSVSTCAYAKVSKYLTGLITYRSSPQSSAFPCFNKILSKSLRHFVLNKLHKNSCLIIRHYDMQKFTVTIAVMSVVLTVNKLSFCQDNTELLYTSQAGLEAGFAGLSKCSSFTLTWLGLATYRIRDDSWAPCVVLMQR